MTKILLVDDEPDTVSTLKFRLEKKGYEVQTATDGLEALETLREGPFDLVLADFMMPELNGLELARLMKGSTQLFDTRVMLFSCNTDPAFRKRAMDVGVLDFVAKTDGYLRIIERAQEIAPVQEEEEVEEVDEEVFRNQLHSLSRSLQDVLKLAKMGTPLSETTEYALESANRIAGDIERLTGPHDPQPPPAVIPIRDSDTGRDVNTVETATMTDEG